MNTEKNALAKREEMPVGKVNIEHLLVAAMEKGPDIVERMMVVRRELNAEAAKAAYDRALADFQDEMPPIPKGRAVVSASGEKLYSYAPFEKILAAVKPVLRRHGLSFTLDTDVESKDGWVIATCKITHTGGHHETSKAKFPLGGGTKAMSTTQIYAAALSFASRRVFCNALGIVTEGEDKDGQGANPAQHGPSSKSAISTPPDAVKDAQRRLWELLKPVRGERDSWFEASQWLKANNIIPAGASVTKLTAAELAEAYDKASVQLDINAGK